MWDGVTAAQKRQRHGAGVSMVRAATDISKGVGDEVGGEVHNGSQY